MSALLTTRPEFETAADPSRNMVIDPAVAFGRPVVAGTRILVPDEHRVFMQAADGERIGALSKAAAPRWRDLLAQVQSVRVAAVLIRRRADEGAEYQDRLRRDAWQVVVPEITCCVADPRS